MAQYLDINGLSHFWSNIKTYITEFVDTNITALQSDIENGNIVPAKLNGNTIGGSNTPIYLNEGIPTACGVVDAANHANTLGIDNVGSESQPIYLVAGVPTVCDLPAATTSANGLMSSGDKTKLDALPTNAALNTTLSGKASTAVATASANGLMSKENFTKLNALPTNDALNTTLSGKASTSSLSSLSTVVDELGLALNGKASTAVATTSANGLMSSGDKTKLDALPTNAALNTTLSGKASTAVATTSANGLMSSTDKTKLNGIAAEANKTIVDTALNSSSTNPIQNKAVYTALSGKASTAVATTSANGLMSSADKTKLNALPTNATLDSTYAKKTDISTVFKYVGSYTSTQMSATGANSLFDSTSSGGQGKSAWQYSTCPIGSVINMSTAFSDNQYVNGCVNGSTKTYPVGTNIVKVEESKWDVLAGFVDIESITNAEIDTITV